MRALLAGLLLIAGCARENSNFLDPLAQPDLGIGGDGVNDAGVSDGDVTGIQDLAIAPIDDLAGARLMIASACGGVYGSISSVSGKTFMLSLVIVDGLNRTIDTDAEITLAVGSADHPTVLTGGGTVKASHGNVTYSASIDHWGTGQLTATAPGIMSLDIPFTIHGSHVLFETQPSDTVAGQTMTPAVQVLVTDETGATDESIQSMSVGLSGCGQSPSTNIATVSAVAGIATFDHLAIGPACDAYQLQLNPDYALSGLPPLSNPFKVTKGPPSQLMLSTGTAFVTRRQQFTVTASIADAGGNVIAVAPTQVTLSLSGATLTGSTTQTTAAGVATFAGLVVDPAGTYTLTGHAAGVPDGTLPLHVSAWEFRSNPFGGTWLRGVAVAIDDPDTVYAWSVEESRVSHDGGLTWTVLRAYPNGGAIVPDPADATTLWNWSPGVAGNYGFGVWRSNDRGINWALFGPSGLTNPEGFLISPASPRKLLFGRMYGGGLGMFVSDDGASWQPVGPAFADTDEFFGADIAADGTMYVSAGQYAAGVPSGFVARSSDGGLTWTKLLGVPLLRGIVADPFTPTTLFATRAADTLFGVSTDSGATWTFAGGTSSSGAITPNPVLQGHYLLPGASDGVLLTTDGAQTWTPSFDANDTPHAHAEGMAFAPSRPTTVYLAVDDGIFLSVTSGE